MASDFHTPRMRDLERNGMAKADDHKSRREGRHPQRGRPPSRRPVQKPGAIRLARIDGNDFEMVHPRGVRETEPDYEEGLEIWRAGDPEGAATLCAMLSQPATTISGFTTRSAGSPWRSFAIRRSLGGISATRSTSAAERCRRNLAGDYRRNGRLIGPFTMPSKACCDASRPSAGTTIAGPCALARSAVVRPVLIRRDWLRRKTFRDREKRWRDLRSFFDFEEFFGLAGIG